MNGNLVWLDGLASVVLLFGHEALVTVAQRRRPDRMARSAHAALRVGWVSAVSPFKGAKILAVQRRRNSLLLATMTASTAVLGLMGTATLAAPSGPPKRVEFAPPVVNHTRTWPPAGTLWLGAATHRKRFCNRRRSAARHRVRVDLRQLRFAVSSAQWARHSML